jgi:8-oxo-dGTP diphosphatase
MNHRIRVATIIVDNQKVLLVKHVHPKTGFAWWIPPGGGLEDKDASIFDCAKREAFEETNLKVDISRIIYIREFLGNEMNLEIFTLADNHQGESGIGNIHGNGADEDYIKDIGWFSKEELQDVVVFPEILKDEFWDDYIRGFPTAKYLGRQIEKSRE